MQKVYNEADISNIASAIREVTGETNTYKVSEMDEAILDIYESRKALEIAVRTCDMAEQVVHPVKTINEEDYAPEVIDDIERLLYNIKGGE
jgi:hypothetical protein